MKKHIVIISIAILLSTVLFSGCNGETGNEGKKTFVGTWEVKIDPQGDIKDTWIIREDNTCTHKFGNESENFTWEDTGAVLCFAPIFSPNTKRCGDYTFSSDYNSFTWKTPQGMELVYSRV